ncbi:MAG: RluA family pseudouridine synthase [Planctomycetes bacterium]|nr:RluA family pseudouridine synthase [Planctomycetota bacterium]
MTDEKELESRELPDDDDVEAMTVDVSAEFDGVRLDKFLAARFPEHSRTFLQNAIKNEGVRIDDALALKPSTQVESGQAIELSLPKKQPIEIIAEDIPLAVIYEDEYFAVINKPAGMLTHPTFGQIRGTLVNAILHRYRTLSDFHEDCERPGIVHRLDKFTSGAIVIARDEKTHRHLAAQFRDRNVKKEYLAIACGVIRFDENIVDQPIGRNKVHRERMCIDKWSGREAFTKFEVRERFRAHTLVVARPRSGRQHQIRVHLLHIGHPILCDDLYTSKFELRANELRSEGGNEILISRQALHAKSITLFHPAKREFVTFEAPVPEDFARTLIALREDLK